TQCSPWGKVFVHNGTNKFLCTIKSMFCTFFSTLYKKILTPPNKIRGYRGIMRRSEAHKLIVNNLQQ
ncbi:MAG: hypothetical protein CMD25_08335, partial [Flavobacteriales bacterium]|nr:hypothetical protein [Flavobacteriales bacterium]